MIIKIIIMIVYLFILIYYNVPQIEKNNNIAWKIYIFCGIFIFEFITELCKSFYKGDVIDVGKIVKQSVMIALIAAIGYSFWTDLVNLDESKLHVRQLNPNDLVPGINAVNAANVMHDGVNVDGSIDNNIVYSTKLTLFISLFMSSGYLVDHIFQENKSCVNDCLNLIYKIKTDNKIKK